MWDDSDERMSCLFSRREASSWRSVLHLFSEKRANCGRDGLIEFVKWVRPIIYLRGRTNRVSPTFMIHNDSNSHVSSRKTSLFDIWINLYLRRFLILIIPMSERTTILNQQFASIWVTKRTDFGNDRFFIHISHSSFIRQDKTLCSQNPSTPHHPFQHVPCNFRSKNADDFAVMEWKAPFQPEK